jgi:predicted acylesterase/phospholipase RssA
MLRTALASLRQWIANLWPRIRRLWTKPNLPQPPTVDAPAPDNCTLCDANIDPIGTKGEPVRALAFGGGGFDTLMQLGVAHAFLVSDAQPPDVVVGISAGAVHAAALAEILKAADKISDAPVELRREARMSRFRSFLYEAQELPQRLASTLPDPYEADAGRPLEPHSAATRPPLEHDARQSGLRAKSGLIDLLNTLAGLRLTVAALTRYLRVILGFNALPALRGWQWWHALATEIGRLLRVAIMTPLASGQLLWTILRTTMRGQLFVLRERFLAKPSSVRRRLLLLLTGDLTRRRERGYTAGGIIFRGLRSSLAFFLYVALIVLLGIVAYFHRRVTLQVTITTFTALSIGVLLVASIGALRTRALRFITDGALAYFDLLHDLGNEFVVTEGLARVFDTKYFGSLPLRAVVRRSLLHDIPPPSAQAPRTFGGYAQGPTRMHIVPFCASLTTGDLKALPPSTPVVTGLLASVSSVPFLKPAQLAELPGDWLVDAINVSNEPTTALRSLLRKRLHPDASALYVYPVSSLPIEKQQFTDRRAPLRYVGLINVVMRVRQLRRFRHAKLERELTKLYRDILPARSTAPERRTDTEFRALKCYPARFFANKQPRHHVRAEVFPIEPSEYPITLSERLVEARSKISQQDTIAETIADGCRLTIERLFPRAITTAGAEGAVAVACTRAMHQRTGRSPGEYSGAPEICKHCTLHRDGQQDATTDPAAKKSAKEREEEQGRGDPAKPDAPLRQHLATASEGLGPEWPLDPRFSTAPFTPTPIVESAAPTGEEGPIDAPARTFLFSGGVFRGVFLVGVLNALNELGLYPTLLAGSSVGSITAAMAGRLFTMPENQRHEHLSLLAGTFLGLDHIVITDRFADFVRRLTLRAAEAKFSPRELDLFLRNYDRPTNARFTRSMRHVTGGLDHLFYVSPFELAALVRAFRLQQLRKGYRLLRRYFQELLDRGGVSLEVLGTEPLAFLIREHVLAPDVREHRTVPFAPFTDKTGQYPPIEFLVTATSLLQGYLHVVGLPTPDKKLYRATLVDTLLASSAFPGVFRPRWGWEMFEGEEEHGQFVDGGVMDNLPFTAVVDFMRHQVDNHQLPRRPPSQVPHLLFAASLESERGDLSSKEVARIARRWPTAQGRVRELSHNRKIDDFATVQDELREIYATYAKAQAQPASTPLDIAVVAVKPRWLCGTFGFHPMVGFRRARQAASIAHGCASTFARFRAEHADHPKWTEGWGIKTAVLQEYDEERLRQLRPAGFKNGKCHFRSTMECPFSARHLRTVLQDEALADAIGIIYTQCGKAATHTPT